MANLHSVKEQQEDCLTLYAYREDGELLWKLPDYSKALNLPNTSYVEPVQMFDVYDDKITAVTAIWELCLYPSCCNVTSYRVYDRF